MFKKPLSNLKTSAPLRSSDRRKLKSRVLDSFSVLTGAAAAAAAAADAEGADVGDLLVPEGIRSAKFQTHLDEPGVAYLAPDGDPLWFTIGKGSDELIPSVYTLWKRPDLLPWVSTPASVIPILIGGADLMIPGVVQHPPGLVQHQLVSVTEFQPPPQEQQQQQPAKVGAPLAVGRMAVSSQGLGDRGGKGKAVLVLHTWKDWLWDMGSKGEVPEPRDVAGGGDQAVQCVQPSDAGGSGLEDAKEGHVEQVEEPASVAAPDEPQVELTPQEVSAVLHTSLLQAIHTSLSSLPPSSFPMPSTTFYTTHLLPSRPAYNPSSIPIDIKHSTHKSLTAFLKAAEKANLVSLKSIKTELFVTGVSTKHPEVAGHRPYLTMREAEAKKACKEGREEEERGKVNEMRVVEKWKPHLSSVKFFQEIGRDTTALYALPEIKALVSAYVAENNLVNPHGQQYVNLDALLVSALHSSGGKPNRSEAPPEFLKREELARKLADKMQAWHEIQPEDKETVIRKGQLKPISVVTKMRQGRKASTLITNFEPFFLSADALAEELRKTCASATSVSPVSGKGPNAGLEVLVQGKQIKAVVELLVSKGVPKKWIEAVDVVDKK